MITSSEAIIKDSDDKLGRKRLADRLATAITDHKYVESLVIGLYGKWGTGKSSLLNLTENALNASPTERQPIVVRFNPWNYSNQTDLISQFFNVLSSALQRPDLGTRYKETSKLLSDFSKKVKPLEALPHIGSFLKILNVALGVAEKGLDNSADEYRDLNNLKNDISQTLATQDQKIVVILDDIDRLSSIEIRQVFQLVKSLADFSNVIYMLAFDRTIIIPALEKVQEGDGEAYLEKIINIPIELPIISKNQIQAMLIERINRFAQNHDDFDWSNENEHCVKILSNIIPLFSTIRSLDRFANVLFFIEPLIDGEVNYSDFIAISALQAVNINLFHIIRDQPLLFIDTPESRLSEKLNQDTKKTSEVDEYLSKYCKPENIGNFKALLIEMFPKLHRSHGGHSYADEMHQSWKRDRRICASLEVFQTYFQLEVSPEIISAKRMSAILRKLDHDSFEASFQSLIDSDEALIFLRDFQSHLTDNEVRDNIQAVIRVLFNRGDAFHQDISQFPFKLDGATTIMQIVYALLHLVEDESVRFNCLRTAIESASESLYPAIQSIAAEAHSHGRDRGSIRPDKQLVSLEHLDELQVLCATKIKEWADNGKLADHEMLTHILYMWSHWGKQTDIENFVLVDLNDGNFIRFVKAAVNGRSRPLSTTFDGIASFDLIENRIKRISESQGNNDDILRLIKIFEKQGSSIDQVEGASDNQEISLNDDEESFTDESEREDI